MAIDGVLLFPIVRSHLMTFLPHPAEERNSTCTNSLRHSERDVGHASLSCGFDDDADVDFIFDSSCLKFCLGSLA